MKRATPEAIAAAIPSLGGREIGPFLRSLAQQVPEQGHVVELGAWLGAGSAQLALGLMKADRGAVLNCYDRWAAPTPDETAAAAAQGMELIAGMNTLPLAEEALSWMEAPARFRRGEIGAAHWDGAPIALHVDHMDDDSLAVSHALRTFGPSWMAGQCVVVFMGMAEAPEIAARRGCPRARLMLENPDSFREVFADLGPRCRAWFYARPCRSEAWVGG